MFLPDSLISRVQDHSRLKRIVGSRFSSLFLPSDCRNTVLFSYLLKFRTTTIRWQHSQALIKCSQRTQITTLLLHNLPFFDVVRLIKFRSMRPPLYCCGRARLIVYEDIPSEAEELITPTSKRKFNSEFRSLSRERMKQNCRPIRGKLPQLPKQRKRVEPQVWSYSVLSLADILFRPMPK